MWPLSGMLAEGAKKCVIFAKKMVWCVCAVDEILTQARTFWLWFFASTLNVCPSGSKPKSLRAGLAAPRLERGRWGPDVSVQELSHLDSQVIFRFHDCNCHVIGHSIHYIFRARVKLGVTIAARTCCLKPWTLMEMDSSNLIASARSLYQQTRYCVMWMRSGRDVHSHTLGCIRWINKIY